MIIKLHLYNSTWDKILRSKHNNLKTLVNTPYLVKTKAESFIF